MATILVVDSASENRRKVGRLLETVANYRVIYAADGLEALAQLEHRSPNVVLTALPMPQMNGLELVSALKLKYPHLPVVVMPEKGSEELSVQALRNGAVSYIPKRLLHKYLLNTVYNVLAVLSNGTSRIRLMERMTRREYAFTLDNDLSLVSPLISYLQEKMGHCSPWEEGERIRAGVALEEAVVNGLVHGNLGISSDVRESGQDEFVRLVEQRRQESPYQERRLHIVATVSPESAIFVVRDEGEGFDPEALPDPTDPDNLERASGRGVLLMRTFMDEVSYNQRGNEVKLIKYRSSSQD